MEHLRGRRHWRGDRNDRNVHAPPRRRPDTGTHHRSCPPTRAVTGPSVKDTRQRRGAAAAPHAVRGLKCTESHLTTPTKEVAMSSPTLTTTATKPPNKHQLALMIWLSVFP